MTFDPLNGNQHYSGLITDTSQISKINIGKVTCPPLNSGLVTSDFLWVNSDPSFLNKKLYSLTGNSSTSFVGLGADTAQFLNANPGEQASIAIGGPQVVIPPGATVVGAYAVDNGYTGDLLDIGFTKITGSTPSAHLDNIFSGLTQVTVNAGGIVVAIPSITGDSDLGSAGDTPIFTSTVSTTGTTGITVTSAAEVTASTGLSVTVYYLL